MPFAAAETTYHHVRMQHAHARMGCADAVPVRGEDLRPLSPYLDQPQLSPHLDQPP